MSRRFALKRLTASDLTFFQWHYDNQNAGNQKAINLNADVFAEQLFPRLDAGSYKVGLTLIGPGDAPPLTMTRKILKNPAYKNWRLNGETVDKQEERFSILRPGDYALMVFEGENEPQDLQILFFAKALPADAAARAQLSRYIPAVGRQSMKALSADDLQVIADEGGLAQDHFLRTFVIDEDLIDAASGIADAVQRFLKRVGRRGGMDKSALLAAKAQGDAIGELGESLVDLYLERRLKAGKLIAYTWISRKNAIAPMDFDAILASGVTESLEVKTTSGDFERPFHVALSELREAAMGDSAYRIFRVYHATASGAKLRISSDFRTIARSILTVFEGLPQGVVPDSVSISPAILGFGKQIQLNPGE